MIEVDWVCEYCYRAVKGNLPDTWRLILQSAVCPECQDRVAKDGGIFAVKGGEYAQAEDPRRDD